MENYVENQSFRKELIEKIEAELKSEFNSVEIKQDHPNGYNIDVSPDITAEKPYNGNCFLSFRECDVIYNNKFLEFDVWIGGVKEHLHQSIKRVKSSGPLV